jgi:molecular chaperone DnaK (HSP70)
VGRETDLRWKWTGERKRFYADEISAMILTKMKEIAERQLTTIFTTTTNII